jgi:hypothetical protein
VCDDPEFAAAMEASGDFGGGADGFTAPPTFFQIDSLLDQFSQVASDSFKFPCAPEPATLLMVHKKEAMQQHQSSDTKQKWASRSNCSPGCARCAVRAGFKDWFTQWKKSDPTTKDHSKQQSAGVELTEAICTVARTQSDRHADCMVEFRQDISLPISERRTAALAAAVEWEQNSWWEKLDGLRKQVKKAKQRLMYYQPKVETPPPPVPSPKELEALKLGRHLNQDVRKLLVAFFSSRLLLKEAISWRALAAKHEHSHLVPGSATATAAAAAATTTTAGRSDQAMQALLLEEEVADQAGGACPGGKQSKKACGGAGSSGTGGCSDCCTSLAPQDQAAAPEGSPGAAVVGRAGAGGRAQAGRQGAVD